MNRYKLFIAVTLMTVVAIRLWNQFGTSDGAALTSNTEASVLQLPKSPVLTPGSGNDSGAEAKLADTSVISVTAGKDDDTLRNLSQKDQEKFKAVIEIWDSKADNDPRLDQMLKNLSPKLKAALISFHDQLPTEDRSGRGLIAFLLARDVKSEKDLGFLKSVLKATPCMSLKDCKKSDPDPDSHTAGLDATTLAYPELASLYQLAEKIRNQPDLLNQSAFVAEINMIIGYAKQHPSSAVRDRAAVLAQLANRN